MRRTEEERTIAKANVEKANGTSAYLFAIIVATLGWLALLWWCVIQVI